MDVENLSRALHLARLLRDRQERIKMLEAGPDHYDALVCVGGMDSYQGEPTGLTITRSSLIDKAITARTEAAEALRAIGVTVSAESEKEMPMNTAQIFGSYSQRRAG